MNYPNKYPFGIVLLWLAFSARADLPPIANDDVRTIALGTKITLNLLLNDLDPDVGETISIVDFSQPNAGTIQQLSDNSIVFEPPADFTGQVSFAYTIQDSSLDALTDTAEVTINVVASIIEGESTTANSASVGAVLERACSRLNANPGQDDSTGNQQLRERCAGLIGLQGDANALSQALRQIAPEETISQIRLASQESEQQTVAIRQRLNLLNRGGNQLSFNGIALNELPEGGAAGESEQLWDRLGVFASYQNESNERDLTDNEAGYDADSHTFTLGIDYAVSKNFFLGLAGSFTNSKLDYSNQGGSLDSDISSAFFYGLFFQDNLSVDLQLGFGSMNFDSNRRINYTDALGTVDFNAKANTEGEQFQVNTQLQYDWNREALTLSPFVRLEYINTEIEGYGENGAGGLEVILEDQSLSQLTYSLGLEGSYALAQDWGVLLPIFQASFAGEASYDLEDVRGRFAFDNDASDQFVLVNDGGDSAFFNVGVGLIAVIPHGLQLFTNIATTLAYDNTTSYQLQAGFHYEL